MQSQRFMVFAGLAVTLAVLVATVCIWRFIRVQMYIGNALAECECCEERAR